MYHSKRHQVLVTIIVEKDPTLDMNLSTKRESYSLEVSRVVNTMEPRDNVQITIRYCISFKMINLTEQEQHIPIRFLLLLIVQFLISVLIHTLGLDMD